MKKQKAIIIANTSKLSNFNVKDDRRFPSESERNFDIMKKVQTIAVAELNELLERGWRVVSATPMSGEGGVLVILEQDV